VTTFEKSFAFHNQTSSTSFAGIPFDITPGSLKWSINLTTTSSSADSSQPLTIRYKLSSLGASSVNISGIDMLSLAVTKQTNQPRINITTYLFALHRAATSTGTSNNLVAMVDGVLTPLLSHDGQRHTYLVFVLCAHTSVPGLQSIALQ
jgi:hypothetical protein